VLLKLGNAQQAAGQLSAALTTYRRLCSDYAGHPAAHMAARNLASTAEDMGRYEEAARQFEGLSGGKGADPQLWLAAGRCWEFAGKRDPALEAYRKFIELHKDEGAKDEMLAMVKSRFREISRGRPLLGPPPPPPVALPEPTVPATEPPKETPSAPAVQPAQPAPQPAPEGRTTAPAPPAAEPPAPPAAEKTGEPRKTEEQKTQDSGK
jgi:tetratricopeptide (TPR) repeat protein